MKQEISITQLGELSVKGLDKYREISKARDWVNPHGETTWTIGQMIEFLDEYSPISIMGHQSEWHGGKWYWEGGSVPSELTMAAMEASLKEYVSEELCNALWSAAKEVLDAPLPEK